MTHYTDKEVLRKALEALEDWKKGFSDLWEESDEKAITAIKQALAALVQPVATGKPVLQVEQLLNDMLDTLPYNSPEYWIGRIKEVLSLYTTPPAAPVQEPVAYRQTGWAAHRDQYAVPVLFNPYTGDPRDVRDVQSDPQGILIVPPGKVEMLAAKPTHQQGLQVATPPAAQPAVPLTGEQTTDKDRLDWLNNNFFNRENVDWLTGNVSRESLMWVFFAPTKVQGDIRRVINAAIDRDGITAAPEKGQ
jgi:hypothetical protein